MAVDGSVTLPDFIVLYLSIRQRQLKSIDAVGACLRRMTARLPVSLVCDLQRVHVSDYIASRLDEGKAAKTINVELLSLSAAFNYARKHWGWQIDNPVSGQYLREPEGRLRYLSQQEAKMLIIKAATLRGFKGEVLPDFIVLALNTGMRKTELLMLKWSQIERNRITLEPEITKNCKRRLIPLNATAQAVLERRRGNGSPWVFRKGNRKIVNILAPFKVACELAGIEDFRIHDLRHTFASWLVMADVPLLHVQDLLGHSSVKMTERYAHLSQDALIKAVSVLDGLCERDTEGCAAVPKG